MSPNKPKTQHRAIRIPEDVWRAVRGKAAAQKTDASKVINRLLKQWLEDQ